VGSASGCDNLCFSLLAGLVSSIAKLCLCAWFHGLPAVVAFVWVGLARFLEFGYSGGPVGKIFE